MTKKMKTNMSIQNYKYNDQLVKFNFSVYKIIKKTFSQITNSTKANRPSYPCLATIFVLNIATKQFGVEFHSDFSFNSHISNICNSYVLKI